MQIVTLISNEENYNNYLQILNPIDISYNFIKDIPTDNDVCFKAVLDLDGLAQNNYFGRYSENEWSRFLISIKNNNGRLNEPILLRIGCSDIAIEDGAHRLKALKTLIDNNLICPNEVVVPINFKIDPKFSFKNLNNLFNSLYNDGYINKNDYVQALNQLIILRVEHKNNKKDVINEVAHRMGQRSPGSVWKTVHHNWRAWNKTIKDPDRAVRGFGKELVEYEKARRWAAGLVKEKDLETPSGKRRGRGKGKHNKPPKPNFAKLAAIEREKEMKRLPVIAMPDLDLISKEFNKIWLVTDYDAINPAFGIDKADAYIVKDKKYILKSKLQEILNIPKRQITLEGGKGGHMAHPYEIFQGTELFDFFDKFLTGEYEAEEKVGGVNIFWGIEADTGKVVFDYGSGLFTDISKEFSLTHPSAAAFNAGAEAIIQSVQKLSSELIRELGLLQGNLINTEIIYGEIPDVVPYSDTTNFIKMHNIIDTEGNNLGGSKILDKIVSAMGQTHVTSPVVEYIGTDLRDTKQIITNKTSTWEFRASLPISKEKIKAELNDIYNEYKAYPEAQALLNNKNMTEDEIFATARDLAKKIESKVLTNMVSNLKTSTKEYPDAIGVEGLILNSVIEGKPIKITGDFEQLNKDLQIPLEELKDLISQGPDSIYSFISKELGLKTVKISKSQWDRFSSPEDFLSVKSSRFKSTKRKKGQDPNVPFNKISILNKIEDTMDILQDTFDKHKEITTLKQKDILKSIQLSAHQLLILKKKVTEAETYVDLTNLFASFLGLNENNKKDLEKLLVEYNK